MGAEGTQVGHTHLHQPAACLIFLPDTASGTVWRKLVQITASARLLRRFGQFTRLAEAQYKPLSLQGGPGAAHVDDHALVQFFRVQSEAAGHRCSTYRQPSDAGAVVAAP